MNLKFRRKAAQKNLSHRIPRCELPSPLLPHLLPSPGGANIGPKIWSQLPPRLATLKEKGGGGRIRLGWVCWSSGKGRKAAGPRRCAGSEQAPVRSDWVYWVTMEAVQT